MTPIDYKALAERIQQAIDAPPLTVPEVAIIDKADLRTVVTMLEGMADVKPVAWMALAYSLPSQATTDEPTAIRWRKAGGEVVPLYTHPAPQPQPVLSGYGDYGAAIPGIERPCTCHPDDNPPVPCTQKYALNECRAASEPTEAQIEQLRSALVIAEAALADIGDAEREPGDDLKWCEQRAAEALPDVRAALAAKESAL